MGLIFGAEQMFAEAAHAGPAFGFDADQRRGALKKTLAVLGADTSLGNRIIAKGNPGAFSLAKDIVDLGNTRPKR